MVSTIRRGPLSVAILLLVAAGGLGALLVHDGVGASHEKLTQAKIGESVQAKGILLPFKPPPGTASPARWAPVMEHIGNATYILQDTPSDLMVLVTAPVSHEFSTAGPIVVTGIEAVRMPHPDQPWRTLVLIQATAWDEPILFR